MVILVIQFNYGQSYENTIMALETALNIGKSIGMIQKPFISAREISHNAYNFYWPKLKRKEIKVMTIVQKNVTDMIVIEQRTNFNNHPYFMMLEICELDL